MTNANYLDDLCGSIAGLKRLEDDSWAHLKQDETISYPDEGLNILADIEARSLPAKSRSFACGCASLVGKSGVSMWK